MLLARIVDAVRASEEVVALPANFRDRLAARWDAEDTLLARLQDQPFLTGTLTYGALTIPQFRLLIALTMSVRESPSAYERDIAGIARDDLIGGMVYTIERRLDALITDILIRRHTRENVTYDLSLSFPSVPFPTPAPPPKPRIRVVVDNTQR